MTSAFQVNAFQNNAFQIDISGADTHDGADSPRKFHLPIYIGEGHRQQPISNIIRIYDKAKTAGSTDKLLSIVEPFVIPENEEEAAKRSKAQRIVSDLPNIDRVNLEYLAKNQAAIEQLLNEMERIDTILKQLELIKRQDDMLLILISACV